MQQDDWKESLMLNIYQDAYRPFPRKKHESCYGLLDG